MDWGWPLKRDFAFDMQDCPNRGGGEREIIAALLEQPLI